MNQPKHVIRERYLTMKGDISVGRGGGSIRGEPLRRGTQVTIEAPGPIRGKARVTAYSGALPGLRFIWPWLARQLATSMPSYDMTPEELLGGR